MKAINEPEEIDWNLATWEGSRREQIRRWSELSLEEILNAQEEMANLIDELHGPGASLKHRDQKR